MQIASEWADVLDINRIHAMLDDLEPFLPDRSLVLRAFTQPVRKIKVLIVGQDPYPTPGHAQGLAFSVASSVRPLPPTLRNIFKEYCSDTGYPEPSSGDLTPWHEQGVMLLNRTLTVAPGVSGSHRKKGWEEITFQAVDVLAKSNPNLVAILWGSDAAALADLFYEPILSAHPSPLAAHRGFFGSRPFSRANALLVDRGISEVQWRLP